MLALASPASLKGVLTAVEAGGLVATGLRRVDDLEVEELPVADGGEGTMEVLAVTLGGAWGVARVSDPLGRQITARYLMLPSGLAVVEAAEAIGLSRLQHHELDPLHVSSRGLGELILATLFAARPAALLVGLGGVATVDGGAGMRGVIGSTLGAQRIVVACDVLTPLLGERGAARLFGPQKGATPEMVEELEARLEAMAELLPVRDLPGAGAAGGIGAMLAALGAELVPGAEHIMEMTGFEDRAAVADLVVTGEGRVDRGTREGKAPGKVAEVCARLDVPCVVFGGEVEEELPGATTVALSGRPEYAAEDLVELGERLALQLVERQRAAPSEA
jgi:glycerate 2-kinase